MTVTTLAHDTVPTTRVATRRHLLMCSPEHFEVSYEINPWMDPTRPVDAARALSQWTRLRDTYQGLGHRVDLVEPVAGLPDMVFAANGGIVSGGRAMASSFTHPQRQPEGAAYRDWFEAAGFAPATQSVAQNEGEGDLLTLGPIMLGGTGFRTSRAAHAEVSEYFGVPVITLELVDPRFYHLDTALAVLDERTIAYFPGAFSAASNAALRHLFPGSILATEDDAVAFGLNAMSDGLNVVLSEEAVELQEQLRAHGFNPVGLDMSELRKAGGSAKCCTLELRA